MKKISLWMLVFTLATPGLHAQDAATQQQLDKLSGQLQDIIDTEAAQGKRLDALEHDFADLRDKVNTPAVNNYASNDDLQKLASQLQEIDRKRQQDRELILGKIEDLAKLSENPPPAHVHHPVSEPRNNSDDTASTADATPQKCYQHKVEAGETLSAIIKAYGEQGVKVTVKQVLKANPGLDPKKLYVDTIVNIPMPDTTIK